MLTKCALTCIFFTYNQQQAELRELYLCINTTFDGSTKRQVSILNVMIVF